MTLIHQIIAAPAGPVPMIDGAQVVRVIRFRDVMLVVDDRDRVFVSDLDGIEAVEIRRRVRP